MLNVVTWNVNSIRARLDNIVWWVENSNFDVLLLQEIKCEAQHFPMDAFANYNIVIHGQKSYNGVAILSRYPLEDITEGLPTLVDETQARYIEAVVNAPQGVARVASVYVPNGGSIGSDKYIYKLRFMEHLRNHMARLLTHEEITVIGGDYNIAPTDDDVHDPAAWHEQTLCSMAERLSLQSIFHLGYYDALRIQYPEGAGPYTWWDYRSQAWLRDEGLRIDHLLLSPLAADVMKDAGVAKQERGKDKASDHAPVWCHLEKRAGLWD
ncbi:MAG: exodeoxyribonuclease III [Alphaproteobacteria bacterium]